MRTLSVAAVLAWLVAAPASAQLLQPVVTPSSGIAFLPRYDFQLSAAALAIDNERYSWDAHFGGQFDVLDYQYGRLGTRIDYEVVMGNELRIFDPNQGNYTLEGYGTLRVGDSTELVFDFHHVSRHLSDRLKLPALAYNEIAGRILHHIAIGETTVDADLDGGWVNQHSFVDYRWFGEVHLLVRHPVNPIVGVFVRGDGEMYGVDPTMYNRGTQYGGQGEAGVRINGRGAALEIFGGVERRFDAYPTSLEAEQWALAGIRVVSR
ncbi:MAG TPA: hypothetical protein VFA27_02100 [Vicinamibacterales bacterium]|nr:hypothetical protein [Vicinamibacterales bacterium]